MTVHFACADCGSPSIVPPQEFTDMAAVCCKGCGRVLGTWGDLKRRTSDALRREAGDQSVRVVSADPLDTSMDSRRWRTAPADRPA